MAKSYEFTSLTSRAKEFMKLEEGQIALGRFAIAATGISIFMAGAEIDNFKAMALGYFSGVYSLLNGLEHGKLALRKMSTNHPYDEESD